MLPAERLVFQGIPERPPLRLPDGMRLVIWPVCAGALGHLTPDGADGHIASTRAATIARSSQLELARIWDARRVLAHPKSLRQDDGPSASRIVAMA
jgi:hypothetical protein